MPLRHPAARGRPGRRPAARAPGPDVPEDAAGPGGVSRDLAELVRDKAIEGVVQGRLEVDVKAGLAAQVILDRPAERAEQRDFMLNLAQLLSGGGHSAPADLIEGEYTELEPENALLAPPDLRD